MGGGGCGGGGEVVITMRVRTLQKSLVLYIVTFVLNDTATYAETVKNETTLLVNTVPE